MLDIVRVHLIDIKQGACTNTTVFTGKTPIDKDLEKLAESYNKGTANASGNANASAKIKSYYGNKWQSLLGLHTKYGGDDTSDNEDAMSINMSEVGDSLELFNNIVINDEDLIISDIIMPDNVDVSQSKIVESGKHTIKYMPLSVWNVDNILDLKYKIYLATGIPIYRQHLWIRNNGTVIPMNYNVLLSNHNKMINIESLVKYFDTASAANTASASDEIDGIPIDMFMYNNKAFIKTVANDTFTLIEHSDYYVADLNNIIDRKGLSNKDKYQLELLYYGFIALYFPMITNSVFQDYCRNESSIAEIYPDLMPNKNMLLRKYDLLSTITSNAYDVSVRAKNIMKSLYSGITNTIISINNYRQDIELLIILRNLFDLIALDAHICYCETCILDNNKIVRLKKSYNSEKSKDIVAINTILIKIRVNLDTTDTLKLVIFKNGNYIIKTEWREELHMNFEKITEIVRAKVNPIIALINKLGDKVKHEAVNLMEVKDNIVFTKTGMVFYYDTDVTERRFEVIKNICDDYLYSGIIMPKESTVAKSSFIGLEYFFIKGMYLYDSSRIEKSISTNNYYDFLSNSIVKQKWSTIFEMTHLFQIQNAASKLRISINSIKNNTEMDNFKLYLVGMLAIYHKNIEKLTHSITEITHAKSKRALKNLKLNDPLLYDFKKVYNSKIIYGRICQKPHQPLMLSNDEYEALPKGKKDAAVKYWNFTTEKPVWYSCPNAKYPYVKFITNQHPKNFCIPCCKKIEMSDHANIKRQEIHNTCLSTHMYMGEKQLLTKDSHYIATYGKDIEPGRICRLPEHSLEPLFFDIYSSEDVIDQECVVSDGYYLLGIDQHLPGINNIGMFWAVVSAINTNATIFIASCIERIKSETDKYRTILDGDIYLYYATPQALCQELQTLTTKKNIGVSNTTHTMSSANAAHSANTANTVYSANTAHSAGIWNNILKSIAYNYFGINVIEFEDELSLNMILPKGLININEIFPDTHKNLVVLRRNNKYYPIYMLNTEVFKRTGIISTRLFLNESGIMTTIKAVVKTHIGTNNATIDIATIKDFVNTTKYKITDYFINYKNLCYAVMIDNDIYMPIVESHYAPTAGIKLNFNVCLTFCEFAVLKKFIDAFNKWSTLRINYSMWVYINTKTADHDAAFNTKDNIVIGFMDNNTIYYCKQMTQTIAKSIIDIPMHFIITIPATINKIISDTRKGIYKTGMSKALTHKLHYAIYNNYLYQIVLLHFIHVFSKSRNVALRKKIVIELSKIKFDKPTDYLFKMLEDHVEDVDDRLKIQNLISDMLIKKDIKGMLKIFDEISFNFDMVLLHNIQKLSYNAAIKELATIAETFTVIGDISKVDFTFPNIITLCNGVDSGICKSGKLIISKPRLKEIIEQIASSINKDAKFMFNPTHLIKNVNYFRFIRRANETISVEFS